MQFLASSPLPQRASAPVTRAIGGLAAILLGGCSSSASLHAAATADSGTPTDAGMPQDGGAPTDAEIPRDGRAQPAPGRVSWILDSNFPTEVETSGVADAGALAVAYFNTPNTFMSAPAGPSFGRVTQTPHFYAVGDGGTSTQTPLSVALDLGCQGLSPDAGALIYDNESWSWTPGAESQDPVAAYAQASQLVHIFNAKCRPGNPVLFIGTPASDLGLTADAGDEFHGFIALGYAGGIAPSVDILEIQSQGVENDSSEFLWYLNSAAAQARAANPQVRLMAGLALHPQRLPSCEPSIIIADVQASFGLYEGYWLNVQGTACNGSITQAQIGADLLRALGGG